MRSKVLIRFIRTLAIIVGVFFFLVTLLVYFEKESESSQIKNLWDGFWYSIVTVTSVGYGDFVPSTVNGKLVGLAFIVGSLFIYSVTISVLTNYMGSIKEERKMGYQGCKFNGHTVILGWDSFARSVADQLVGVGDEIAIISDDKQDIELIHEHYSGKQKQIYTLYTEYDNFDTVKKSNLDDAKTVFVNGKTDTDKLVNVLTIKGEYPDLNYIVTLDNPNLRETFHSAGVTYPISKLEISSKLLASYIFEPDVARFSEELMSYAESDDDFDIKQFYLRDFHPYSKGTFEEAFFDLKKKYNTILIGISRQDEEGKTIHIKNPEEEVQLQAADYLILIAKGMYEEQLEEFFDVREGVIS
ncbi:MAG: TrkA family potassium uptake protein [Cyclobacteriaceae bacterium]